MITAKRKSGFVTEIRVDGHSFLSDVDRTLGGADEGPDPHELLESALGACTSITVQMYANRKGWKLAACNASVRFGREDRESIVLERIVSIEGDSYRLKEARERTEQRARQRRGAKS